ncbi:hypothetical protein [Pedobacter hartonius]|uniref:PAS fold-containing protein n=1 Tax=Pedobacter hartonius TaxID=425514 RepID=A0A1H4H8Z7_9SPHI|nr:hypothetical protein [Pedobacter hartonius]SEB18297.1 hypothetical protein SAMN05443550_11488 [Pedobacter hartonius]
MSFWLSAQHTGLFSKIFRFFKLWHEYFIEMFARVWREGLTLSGSDTAADLEVDGLIKTFYFNFEYRAIKMQKVKTICLLHTAIDVTEQIINREALLKTQVQEQLYLKEQEINEQLATAPPRFRSDQSFAGFIASCIDITGRKLDQ